MQQLNIVRTSILCALFKVTSKIRKHFIRDTFKFVVAIYSFRMQFIYRISIPTIRTRIYTVNILIYYLKTLHLWLSETQISPIGMIIKESQFRFMSFIGINQSLLMSFFMLGYMVCFLLLLITQGYFSSYLISNTNQPYSYCTYHNLMLHHNIYHTNFAICKRNIPIQQQDSYKTL